MTAAPTIAGEWTQWDGASSAQALAENKIHVWLASLNCTPEKLADYAKLLSPDESARAARFRFDEHRSRFIAARGILRTILGLHLGVRAGDLKFAYGEHGKPSLAEPAATNVEFNVSHSADHALYAVTARRRIGVDIERMKEEGSWLKIAEHYFTKGEASWLATLPEGEMRREFFGLWSEKEALMKAAGTGLHFPAEQACGDTQWKVIRLDAAEGCSAALAFEAVGPDPRVVKNRF